MCGLDQLVSQLTFMRECEQTKVSLNKRCPGEGNAGSRRRRVSPSSARAKRARFSKSSTWPLRVGYLWALHGSQGAKARSVCMSAMHNLESALIEVRKCFHLLSVRCSEFPKIKNAEMRDAGRVGSEFCSLAHDRLRDRRGCSFRWILS